MPTPTLQPLPPINCKHQVAFQHLPSTIPLTTYRFPRRGRLPHNDKALDLGLGWEGLELVDKESLRLDKQDDRVVRSLGKGTEKAWMLWDFSPLDQCLGAPAACRSRLATIGRSRPRPRRPAQGKDYVKSLVSPSIKSRGHHCHQEKEIRYQEGLLLLLLLSQGELFSVEICLQLLPSYHKGLSFDQTSDASEK